MLTLWIKEKIRVLYPDTEFEVLVPPDFKMGDFSINLAFVVAKSQKKNPLEVGNEIAEKLKSDPDIQDRFDQIQAVPPGFVNFFIKKSYLQSSLLALAADPNFGVIKRGDKKNIIIEYSAPNIAKPMHVGHLRSTIIGDALANIFEFLGYNTIRWNYVGDWGTQFGKVIAAYKLWGNKEDVEKDPIQTLLNLYVRYHEELKTLPSLEETGRAEFRKLEEGDQENRQLWEWFRKESLNGLQKIYDALDVRFDVMKGESDYEQDLVPVAKDLLERGLTMKSEGAFIFNLDKYKLPPALIQKSDGASLYITRDLASLKGRIEQYSPEQILYVVANQQALHFEQLFAIAQELELNSSKLVHVKFGMVLGEDGKKLATREGKVVALQEVIDRIKALAYQVVKEKHPDIAEDEAQNVSHVIGIGALKYNDLKQHPYSDIAFNWQAMLDLSGNSGPYLQYTYARLVSILKKIGTPPDPSKLGVQIFVEHLTEQEEIALIRHLQGFGDALTESTKYYTANGLALYLYELATLVSRFYENIRISDDTNEDRKNARLFLVQTTAKFLQKGLELLGIKTLEKI